MGPSTKVKILIRRKKKVIERAYVLAERLGLPLWGEDEAGPYQTIPHPGSSWQPEGIPARQDHQYIRALSQTLFSPRAMKEQRPYGGQGAEEQNMRSSQQAEQQKLFGGRPQWMHLVYSG